jgi:hypothetical protein
LPVRPVYRLFGLALAVGLLMSGCADPEGEGNDAGMDQAVLPLGAVRLTLGPITLGPAEESTRCITAHLPTTVDTDVVEIDSKLELTHHVIFYREGVDRSDNPLHKCPPLDVLSGTNPARAPLYIGEVPQENFYLPPGVGYRLTAGQAYTIEGHFLNASAKTVQATAELILIPTPVGVAVQQADMVFLSATSQLGKKYDGNRPGLPPAVGAVPTKTTIDPAFFGLPDDLTVDVKYFGLTSHQHHMGTEFTISKSSGLDDPGTPLYRNTDWEHPPLERFGGKPLTFGFGEGFRWVCSYANPTSKYVTFGSSAVTDEMCILWAYYYPSIGFRVYFQ